MSGWALPVHFLEMLLFMFQLYQLYDCHYYQLPSKYGPNNMFSCLQSTVLLYGSQIQYVSLSLKYFNLAHFIFNMTSKMAEICSEQHIFLTAVHSLYYMGLSKIAISGCSFSLSAF